VSLTADRPLTGPPVEPPPPTPARTKITYDSVTRRVSFEEMQFVAPSAPFTCDPKPGEVPGIFASAFTCNALVHGNYDKKNSDWVTEISMGNLEDRLQESGDLANIASKTFAAILTQSYTTTKATVKKRKIQHLTRVAPDGRAVLLSAEVHVSKPGLATKYDRAILALFQLESGQHVAWYALRANDSPKDVVQALEDSADTVEAQK